MKTKRAILIILLVISAGLMACGDNDTEPVIVTGEGTVNRMNLAGSCWQITADSGEEYDPVDLAPEYKLDGLRVSFVLEVLTETADVCMLGIETTVISIGVI